VELSSQKSSKRLISGSSVKFQISVEATHVPYVWLHVVAIVTKVSGYAWFAEVRAQSTLMVVIIVGVRVGDYNRGKYLL